MPHLQRFVPREYLLICPRHKSLHLAHFAQSKNGQLAHVVYSADQDTDNVTELYSVPLLGGSTTKLNGAFVSGGNLLSFQLSPNGSRVVYWADQDTDGVTALSPWVAAVKRARC